MNRLPFSPKNGRTFKVVIVCRISTDRQDPRSLDDQRALCERHLDQLGIRPTVITSIASQGSGERLDRSELAHLEELIESGEYDVVISEDLGRICRRIHAVLICEQCEDAGTRLLAINDSVDTASDSWRPHSMFAVMRHEGSNRDTSLRIRRSQQNRFDNGGRLPKPLWGYLGWETAKNDSDLRKDPEAEPIIREVFRRLEDGATFGSVADWLNAKGVPVPPTCKERRWNSQILARVARNPILKGVRVRNRVVSRRVNGTGRRACVPAPAGEYRERLVPHLAFFDAAYHDHVLKVIRDRTKSCGHPSNRKGIPKKRTIWPVQHARCAICRRPYLRTGRPSDRQAACGGSLDYKCWNGLYLSVDDAQRRIFQAVLDRIEQFVDFDRVVAERLEVAWVSDQTSEQRETLERQVVRQEREVGNLVGAIAAAGQIEALAERLRETQESLNEARYQLERLRLSRRAAPTIPTHAELKKLLGEAMSRVIEGDDEACRLMSRVLPDVVLRPVRSLDNENVALQAVFDLDVGAAVAALTEQDHPGVIEREQLVVNLFDLPMHVLYAERLGTVEQRGEKVLKTADELGISYGTAAMARRLWWILEDLGIREAYEPVTAPPEHGWRCRRHLHQRYHFEPLPDANRNA